MGLSIKTSGDLIAVGRLAQAGPETAALMDGPDNGALILFNEDSSIDIVKERDDDQDEKTGQVEATDIDTLSLSAAGTLTQDKATPDGLAWMSSFFCNFSDEAALGSGVFRHSARIGSYPDEAMYFTAAHRRGGSAQDGPADFRRQVGLGVNTFNITANKGEFLQAGVGGRAAATIYVCAFTSQPNPTG